MTLLYTLAVQLRCILYIRLHAR